MHSPATASIQRRLERWELDHLRALAAVQAERIEELERDLADAESRAGFWRDDAFALQRELCAATGAAPGLTFSGALVVVPPEAAA